MTRRRRVSVLLALPLLTAVSCGFWSSPGREDLTDAGMSARWAANRENTVRRQQGGTETFVYLDVVSSGSATFAQSRGYLHAPSLDVGFPVVESVDTVATGRRGAGSKPLGDGWWLYHEAD